MYKTVNQSAPQGLCNIFQFSDTVNNYILRGSSTGLFIPSPRTLFKRLSVIVGLNYGTGYRKIFEVRYRVSRFVKIFLPWPQYLNLIFN